MNSKWYAINALFCTELAAFAEADDVHFLRNPALPMDPQGRARVLALIARGDILIDSPGQNPEKRRARFLLAAVATTKDGQLDADAVHFGARDMLKSRAFRAKLNTLGEVQTVREVELEPEARDLALQGSMLLSAFEVDYFQYYPSFA